MERYDMAEAAERAGISPDQLRRLVEMGVIASDAEDRFTTGHVLRAELVESLVAAGIPLDGLAAAIRDGQVSLDFLDEPVFDRFTALGGVTFAQLSERTGVPVELLMLIREAASSSPPLPEDHVREGELPYADFIQTQIAAGFDPVAVQRLLRVHGDSLRRIAETEVAWFRSELVAPALAAGKRPDEIFGLELAHRLSVLGEPAVLELYRLVQAGTWTAVIIEGLEMQLAAAGLYSVWSIPRRCASSTSQVRRGSLRSGATLQRPISRPSWPGWWSAHRCATVADRSSGWATASCSITRNLAQASWPPSR